MRSPTTFARRLGAAVCAIVLALGSMAVVPAAIAYADCTEAGDFGAGSGCPPPGDTSGSGGGDSWPPTGVDWPPSQDSSSGGNAGGGKGGASTPIVMPDGQEPPPTAHTVAKDTSTATPPTPIVPVDAPATGPAPSAIVMPTSSTG